FALAEWQAWQCSTRTGRTFFSKNSSAAGSGLAGWARAAEPARARTSTGRTTLRKLRICRFVLAWENRPECPKMNPCAAGQAFLVGRAHDGITVQKAYCSLRRKATLAHGCSSRGLICLRTMVLVQPCSQTHSSVILPLFLPSWNYIRYLCTLVLDWRSGMRRNPSQLS